MRLNILVESTANTVVNKTIYGVEVADPNGNLAGRAPVTANVQVYVPVVENGVSSNVLTTRNMTLSYAVVEITSTSPMYTKIDQFINNYDQFTLTSSSSGNVLSSKSGYNSAINRHIENLDGRYPYVCNNMQINVGGMATNNGGILSGIIQGDDI